MGLSGSHRKVVIPFRLTWCKTSGSPWNKSTQARVFMCAHTHNLNPYDPRDICVSCPHVYLEGNYQDLLPSLKYCSHAITKHSFTQLYHDTMNKMNQWVLPAPAACSVSMCRRMSTAHWTWCWPSALGKLWQYSHSPNSNRRLTFSHWVSTLCSQIHMTSITNIYSKILSLIVLFFHIKVWPGAWGELTPLDGVTEAIHP